VSTLFLMVALSQAPEVHAENPNDVAYQIGKVLRCPVCQGMPISESPAPMAQDMMRRVREMVAEGRSREEILAYFEKSYDGWVLLEPKREGWNLALWILPPLGVLAGMWALARSMRRTRASPPQPPAADDDYLRRVREEVDA
jgi:cytochrome c-type biogenesis protein CcmH